MKFYFISQEISVAARERYYKSITKVLRKYYMKRHRNFIKVMIRHRDQCVRCMVKNQMTEKECPPGKSFVERKASPKKEGKKPTIWNGPVQFCASNKQIDKKGYKRVAAEESREVKTARLQTAVASEMMGIAPSAPSRANAKEDLKKVNSAQELMAFMQKYNVPWPMTKKGEPMSQDNFKKSWKDIKNNLKKNL